MAVIAIIKGSTGTPGFTAEIAILSYTIDLGSHGAVASVDTTVTATGEVKTNDTIIFLTGPAVMNAGIAVQTVHTIVDDSFKLRTTNASATAGIDPASGTYTFLRIRS